MLGAKEFAALGEGEEGIDRVVVGDVKDIERRPLDLGYDPWLVVENLLEVDLN